MAADRDQFRRQLMEEVARLRERTGGKVRYIGKRVVHLRVVPFSDSKGQMRFHRQVVFHRQPTGGKSIGLCRQQTFGQPCVFCRLNELAEQASQDRPYKFRNTFWVNGFDVNTNNPQMQIWSLPTSVWEAIAAAVLSEDWADVLDPEVGHPFRIEGVGDGLAREYTCQPARRPYPVPDELLEQVRDPLECVNDETLEQQAAAAGVDLADVFEPDGVELVTDVHDESSDGPADDEDVEEVPADDVPADEPLCLGDPGMYDPDSPECAEQCTYSGECVRLVTKKRKARKPKTTKRPTKQTKVKPPAQRSAKDILESIVKKRP